MKKIIIAILLVSSIVCCSYTNVDERDKYCGEYDLYYTEKEWSTYRLRTGDWETEYDYGPEKGFYISDMIITKGENKHSLKVVIDPERDSVVTTIFLTEYGILAKDAIVTEQYSYNLGGREETFGTFRKHEFNFCELKDDTLKFTDSYSVIAMKCVQQTYYEYTAIKKK